MIAPAGSRVAPDHGGRAMSGVAMITSPHCPSVTCERAGAGVEIHQSHGRGMRSSTYKNAHKAVDWVACASSRREPSGCRLDLEAGHRAAPNSGRDDRGSTATSSNPAAAGFARWGLGVGNGAGARPRETGPTAPRDRRALPSGVEKKPANRPAGCPRRVRARARRRRTRLDTERKEHARSSEHIQGRVRARCEARSRASAVEKNRTRPRPRRAGKERPARPRWKESARSRNLVVVLGRAARTPWPRG